MSKTTFITGANKGLGLETARRLTALGHTVLLGARDVARGRRAAAALGARFVQVDVTDDASVAAAAADVAAHEGRIDVLINNAGITGTVVSAEELTGAEAARVLDTNVAGVVRVTAAFLPLLRASDAPAVVNVTSGLGSVALTHDPERVESQVIAPAYAASKAAVTVLTTQYAKAWADIRFNAVDPGYTATDLNGHSGTQTVTEGTDAIVTLAIEDADSGTGRIIDRYGPVAW
ncbi:SDR family NAD(P)-dependent oxidoreductase [Streptomyces sp. NPDC012461]|jgi:NAD(P)-dependent dehydrogenase (short-subunit alcohol dehydrogenase family)|uniref:SDR family NAD(P)-dependent oxidoreductase n=2 Tax=unclassified Streptomyces TaxID=2593676 RepID=A0A6G3QX42_9ACTN|nr:MULTISPECIES: SDR family NAD(P)-dependent oxidoreductase [unclassified Streptomyces]MBM7089622.1 SDR family NAD(P)-dependent oxidoreductase [Streptomyces sp. S12]NEA87941.1 SDR family NAD(P)-dependent oxidoreductase [Streptomyces sp. SID14436]NEC82288.1 SDR family NAD(P)-dependent oxidoreductase [Streptomyces sp. SID7958]NED18306.1 SDR family NAD(P)-dependent oxidoreductase [Streptomyces sp. SID9913]NED21099.1 SDR family NAD(P)-dependent oxidoreductase [Streptomyces sp. SID9913]